jgi:hypothetical protein
LNKCNRYVAFPYKCTKDKATWNEAKHFYLSGLKNVFQKIGKGAPPGVYDKDIQILLKNGQKLQCRSEVHRARDVIRAKSEDRASAKIVPAAGVSPLNAAAVLNADSGGSDPIHASQTSTPYHRNMGGREQQERKVCFNSDRSSSAT